jgi:hypothetical protein
MRDSETEARTSLTSCVDKAGQRHRTLVVMESVEQAVPFLSSQVLLVSLSQCGINVRLLSGKYRDSNWSSILPCPREDLVKKVHLANALYLQDCFPTHRDSISSQGGALTKAAGTKARRKLPRFGVGRLHHSLPASSILTGSLSGDTPPTNPAFAFLEF